MSVVTAPTLHASGSRKEATARVWLRPGTGQIVVNDRPFEAYFPTDLLRQTVLQPLRIANLEGRMDVTAAVRGGGIHGQAEAVRHALARALAAMDAGLRPVLRAQGLLTRDPRMKERKKYGRKRARKGFQYSKR